MSNGMLHQKTITLRCGGLLTVEGSFNLFDLAEEDRKFLSELVDLLLSYERERDRAAGSSSAEL